MSERIQRWLHAAILAPRAPAPVALKRSAPALTPATGLAIYRHAYRARLQEALADDFPAVQAVLGAELFARLTTDYIRLHPPRDATLNRYGERLPQFVAAWRGRLSARVVATELARLEWALVEAIHAPRQAPIAALDLASLPAEAWPELRLVANPSLRVLTLRAPVNALYEAFRTEGTIAASAVAGATLPAAVAVFRTADGLRRLDLELAAAGVLRRLAAGVALGVAIARLPQRAAPDVQRWFGAWLGAGALLGPAAASSSTAAKVSGKST